MDLIEIGLVGGCGLNSSGSGQGPVDIIFSRRTLFRGIS